jgi:hypothetical protein
MSTNRICMQPNETTKRKLKKVHHFFLCKGRGAMRMEFFKNCVPNLFPYVLQVSSWFILMFLTFPMCFPKVFPITPHFIPYPLLKVLL